MLQTYKDLSGSTGSLWLTSDRCPPPLSFEGEPHPSCKGSFLPKSRHSSFLLSQKRELAVVAALGVLEESVPPPAWRKKGFCPFNRGLMECYLPGDETHPAHFHEASRFFLGNPKGNTPVMRRCSQRDMEKGSSLSSRAFCLVSSAAAAAWELLSGCLLRNLSGELPRVTFGQIGACLHTCHGVLSTCLLPSLQCSLC